MTFMRKMHDKVRVINGIPIWKVLLRTLRVLIKLASWHNLCHPWGMIGAGNTIIRGWLQPSIREPELAMLRYSSGRLTLCSPQFKLKQPMLTSKDHSKNLVGIVYGLDSNAIIYATVIWRINALNAKSICRAQNACIKEWNSLTR
jgi:hypothetical protein